jgi:hypothetical protein|tara:strand:- start:573 stop:1034 length:462 start_codon:yes stop_codon:yes gene_type:complete
MDKRDEKVELRLKIPRWISDALKQYCESFGTNAVSTITPLLVEYLWHPSRAQHILSKNINIIYSDDSTKSGKSNSKPRKKKGTTISDNFDPPKSITQEEGLNHELAVQLFVDWAKGKGHVQADWNATFRNACRGWIKERVPQERDEWEGVKRV